MHTPTRAIALGVFGVPTLVHDGELFWGEDATGMFLQSLRTGWLSTPEAQRVSTLPVGIQRGEHDTNSRPGISRARLAHIAAWSIDLPAEKPTAPAPASLRNLRARRLHLSEKHIAESWTGVVTGLIKIGTCRPRAQRHVYGCAGRRLVWRRHGAQERAASLRHRCAARHAHGLHGPHHLHVAGGKQRGVQPLPGQATQRAARALHALLEYDRLLDVTPRLARCIASLFNPVLYPGAGDHLEITQEELGCFPA